MRQDKLAVIGGLRELATEIYDTYPTFFNFSLLILSYFFVSGSYRVCNSVCRVRYLRSADGGG